MIYLILDTNNWIYLANNQDPFNDNKDGKYKDNKNEKLHFKTLERLNEYIDSTTVILLVCDVVMEEWERNKSKTNQYIEKLENTMRAQRDTIKAIEDNLDDADKSIFKLLFEKHIEKVNLKIEKNKDHIYKVEQLIFKSQKYQISDKTKILAAERAYNKKAPFIGDKSNSMADAYILFGAIEYLEELFKNRDLITYPTFIFISGNKGDFSSNSNPNMIHEDLKDSLAKVNLQFFRSLHVALNDLVESKVFELFEIWEIERHLNYCEEEEQNCNNTEFGMLDSEFCFDIEM